MKFITEEDRNEFLNFVKMSKEQHKSDKERLEYILSHQTSSQMLIYFYVLASLDGVYKNADRFSIKDAELTKSMIKNDAFLKAFELYKRYSQVEEKYSFRTIDVLENLLEADYYDGIVRLFDKPFDERLNYAENKFLIIQAGLPLQDVFVVCDSIDRDEFFYVQKLQNYFKTDSKTLISEANNNQFLRDIYDFFSDSEHKTFSDEFIVSYFGPDPKHPRHLLDTMTPKIAASEESYRPQRPKKQSQASTTSSDDSVVFDKCIDFVFSGKKLTEEQRKKLRELLKDIDKPREFCYSYLMSHPVNYELFHAVLDARRRLISKGQQPQL